METGTVFKAIKCEFMNNPGYMVRQYCDGFLAVEQFLFEDAFDKFKIRIRSVGYDVAVVDSF